MTAFVLFALLTAAILLGLRQRHLSYSELALVGIWGVLIGRSDVFAALESGLQQLGQSLSGIA
jgi:hypothetical protein